MLSAKYDKPEITKLLLKHGADVNAENDCGVTALMMAEESNHKKVANLLRANGAE